MSALLAPPEVLAELDASVERDLSELFELFRIPSVSADSRHAADVARAAEFLAAKLRSSGLQEVTVNPTARHPVVTAAWRGAPQAPTVLVYGHYDVQPPDPLERWQSPPFEPTIRDGRVYGRGVSDDKAPVYIAISTVAAYLRALGRLPLNLVFLLEGEEEIGSPSLVDFVRRERRRLEADLVVSADGGMWRADHPSTMVSTRGITSLEFSLHGADKDLHSGRHGGGINNPLHAMAELVAGLHDHDGRVSVAGFYDDVLPLSDALRQATGALPFGDEEYLAEVGASATFGEPGYSTLERQWYRPTLELNGMWGGYTGEGSKTVLPGEAHAKISCRLVADQDPVEIRAAVERHLRERLPAGMRLSLSPARHDSWPYRLSDGHPGLQAVLGSLREVYGVEPWVVGLGGSVPICETFQSELGMDTLFFSFAVGDEDIHAPNEFFRLHRFEEGRRAWADLLSRLPRAMAGG